jgi:mannose-6-phosphate isomerase-like protein (cupin superfamily)
MKKVNLKEKFGLFDDLWSPRVVGELNGQAVKIAKVKGEFVWHNHEQEDELFYILKGCLKIEFEGQTVTLKEGEILIVPQGVEHRPVAEEETWLMLFEPIETKHTGKVKSERTVEKQEWI